MDNPDRELKAGGFAKVEILTRVDPQAWTVPVEAMVTYAGSTKIFVVREGKAHAVPVATGLEGRGWVELIRSASPRSAAGRPGHHQRPGEAGRGRGRDGPSEGGAAGEPHGPRAAMSNPGSLSEQP